MTDIDEDTLRDSLSWGAIGFGALAVLAPRVFGGVYGTHDSPDLRVMTRLWGTRTTVLGLLLLGAGADEARKLTQLATAMNVADALIVAGAGSGVNKRTRVLGSLSSAAFAAGFGSLLGS
ncbi:MAG: DUF4267 domain-containing protein [Marmoricola sp.]|nr:DUF4267 domain-containing protein [Marmoricola sp.]